jgi:sulfite exporter TauE/SafE
VTELLPLLGTALVTGFLGSAHCLGMCAGLSGVIAVGHGTAAGAAGLPIAAAYNTGRILSYAVLGALVGAVGGAFTGLIPALAGPVRLAGGLLIVLIGLQTAFQWRLLEPLERAGLTLWRRIQPLAQRLLPVTSLPRAIGLGLAWGLIPCGLVYSVLLLAATSADPLVGSAIMLAFGVGTMPAMIATGLGAFRLTRFAGRSRVIAGLLIVVMGLATMAMPVRHFLPGESGGGHHDHGMSWVHAAAD